MKKYLALIAYTFLFTSFSIVQSAEAPKVKPDSKNTGFSGVSCQLNYFDISLMCAIPVTFPYVIMKKCSIDRINVVKDNNGK